MCPNVAPAKTSMRGTFATLSRGKGDRARPAGEIRRGPEAALDREQAGHVSRGAGRFRSRGGRVVAGRLGGRIAAIGVGERGREMIVGALPVGAVVDRELGSNEPVRLLERGPVGAD